MTIWRDRRAGRDADAAPPCSQPFSRSRSSSALTSSGPVAIRRHDRPRADRGVFLATTFWLTWLGHRDVIDRGGGIRVLRPAARQILRLPRATKPRLSLLSVLTALVGYLALRPGHGLLSFVWVAVGTSLAAAASRRSINGWSVRPTRGCRALRSARSLRQDRNRFRLCARLSHVHRVAVFHLCHVNHLSALFILLTLFAYLGLYTPAKRWSRFRPRSARSPARSRR